MRVTARKRFAIYRRELGYFFNSPVAYVVITVFLVLAGYFFYNLLGYFNLASMQVMQSPFQARSLRLTESVVQPLFGNLAVLLLLILPLLTMRLLAEERRAGTAEILFTCPVSDWDVILGKYFAALTVYATMLAMTAVFPALLARYAQPEPGPIVTGYLGLFLLGAAFIAMGLFFSSIGDNQVVAGVATFGCGLLFLLVGWVGPLVSPALAGVLSEISVLEHFASFAEGVVDTHDAIFYAGFVVCFLFLAARVLESNRWRG